MLRDPCMKCSLPFLTRDVVGPVSAGKDTVPGYKQSHEILRETYLLFEVRKKEMF